MRLLSALLIFFTVAFAAHPGVAQSPNAKFITLNPPKSAGDFIPRRINAQGQIIGISGGEKDKVFLLTRGTFTEVQVPGTAGLHITTISINAHGQMAGSYIDHEKHKHGFLLSHGKSLAIDYPGATDTQVWGINTEGDLVGTYNSDRALEVHSFVWKKGEYTSIDFPGAEVVNVFSINDHGQMVGFFTQDNIPHGFLLSHGVRTMIAFPGPTETIPLDINTQGEIVGVFIAHHNQGNGFLWHAGKFSTIEGPASPVRTTAIGINDRGQIVGFYQDGHGHDHGYLRNP